MKSQDTTIERFTERIKGHRGYGFDKPPRRQDYYVAPSASLETYGHTGFTGTCFWVDPEHDLVYVFLSNRIHPSDKNYRINELKIRRRVHQVIYDAMKVEPRRPGLRQRLKQIFFLADNNKPSGSATEPITVSAP